MSTGTAPWLVVGLGNPGPRYVRHRHNVGQMVVDVLAERAGGSFRSHKAQADALECRLAGVRVVLAKPHTYMNLSGGPVSALCRFYRTPVEQVLVVHDELDLPFGQLRLKAGGGEGGHNGLRSMSSALGARNYVRIRFGIGRPPGRVDPAAWVLSDFTAGERRQLGEFLDRAADAAEAVLTEGLAAAQNAFN